MVISDLDTLKKNLKDFCNSNPKKIIFIKKINGKKDYKELAKLCNLNTANNCIPWMREAEGPGLANVNTQTNQPEKCALLKGRNIDTLLRGNNVQRTISIRRKNITDVNFTRKIFKKFIDTNYLTIDNFYESTSSTKHNLQVLQEVTKKIDLLLANNKKTFETQGLELRFYTAFADYFNESRTEPHYMFNKFSAIIKLYEPFVKKFLILKTNDEKWSKQSLDENMIKAAYDITDLTFNVKEMKEEYWKKRTVKETSIRIAYRFRNIESHSATEFKSYEMDKIVFYIFAAILFLYLN